MTFYILNTGVRTDPNSPYQIGRFTVLGTDKKPCGAFEVTLTAEEADKVNTTIGALSGPMNILFLDHVA